MPVITIRGQLGSGAPEIGKLVAADLNIDYVDREIIAGIAEKLDYPEQKVQKQEMPPTGIVKRILDAVEHSYPPSPDTGAWTPMMMYLPPSQLPLGDAGYLDALEAFIKELAASNAIVIRGRGSQFILKDYPGAVHILIVAPLEMRIQRVMQSMNLDEKAARQEINNFDSSRREFIKRYFKADLEAPENYDLIINTGHLDYVGAKLLVLNVVSGRQAGAA